MKVYELIQALAEFDADVEVVLDDFRESTDDKSEFIPAEQVCDIHILNDYSDATIQDITDGRARRVCLIGG
jgi:hypothetical protein